MSTKMLQDGVICNGAIIFGGLHDGGHISKGYMVALPSMSGAGVGYLNTLEYRLAAILRGLDPDVRLQVTWSSDSDCRTELLAFQERTEESQPREWPERMRSERFTRFFQRCQDGSMRRERVMVFVTRPLSGAATSREDELEKRATEASKSFEIIESALRENLGHLGAQVICMDDDQLGLEYCRYLNPLERGQIPLERGRSILQNFQLGEGVGITQPTIGFYLNGSYHGVVTLQSLPQATASGIMAHLTGLAVCNISICANITPLVVSEQIAAEEKKLAKLLKAMRSGRHPRMEAGAGLHQSRITQLVSGLVSPFRCQLIIRVWDKSIEGVQSKISSVKSAILRMKSAKPCEASFPTSAVNLFRCCMPGWSFDRYRDHEHYMDDKVLANLLPMSGSADPGLGTAEALYDDGSGGLLGVSGFGGEPGAESPLHMLVAGKTGSGKSLFANDLLTQTDPHYDFTAIIDDGMSYGGFVRALNGKSFVIEAHGAHTFNYLDPRGPLTSLHLADAEAILLAMCGSAGGGRQAALISGALKMFYADAGADWLDDAVDRIDALCREGILFREFLDQDSEDLSASWAEFCAAKLANPLSYSSAIEHITQEDVIEFRSADKAEAFLHRLAFALMEREDAPTHSDFCQFLEVMALGGGSDASEIDALARELRRWDREGPFGAIFDGCGTFDFNAPLIHLELGRIPEASKDLKRVALLLICNQVRNEAMRRPRSHRKRVVFEEMSSLLEIPDAERVIRDYSERGRKHGIWLIGVIQQLGDRTQSPAFVSIVGNFRQIVFFKQTSAAEARVLADAFQLPESGRELLLSMPNPSRERGSAFLLSSNDEGRPVVKLGCNVVHPEMLFVSGSSGDEHERREAAIAGGGDLMSAAKNHG